MVEEGLGGEIERRAPRNHHAHGGGGKKTINNQIAVCRGVMSLERHQRGQERTQHRNEW